MIVDGEVAGTGLTEGGILMKLLGGISVIVDGKSIVSGNGVTKWYIALVAGISVTVGDILMKFLALV